MKEQFEKIGYAVGYSCGIIIFITITILIVVSIARFLGVSYI